MGITRWMVTLASFYVMVASCGSLNTFSLFSQHMRDVLGYDQESINTISFFKEMGTSLGIVSGLLYNVSGAWLVLLVSAFFNLLGYSTIWLALTERIPHPELWQMCLCICLVGASASFTITAVLVPCANNFPKNQGMILSLLDSTNGLAGGVFTLLFQALFSKASADTSSFVFLLGWFPSGMMLALMGMVKQVPTNGAFSNDLRNMYLLLFFTVLLALYLMFVIFLQHALTLTIITLKWLFGGMLIIMLLPIPIILFSEYQESGKSAEDDISIICALLPESTKDVYKEDDIKLTKEGPNYGDNFTILQAVTSIDLWLIFIATTCGVGAALTMNNNLGQIGLSLGYSKVHTNTFVALLSVWDFLGGVGCGFVSDILLQRWGVPRPFFFTLSLAILAFGSFMVGLGIPGALFVGSILVGISLGGQWSVLFTMVAEIFGLKNYGTLQNIPTIAKGVGMYILSVRLAGVLYDREAMKSDGVPTNACFGSHCYRDTFFLMGGACIFGCLMSTLLTIRTSKFYKHVVRQRLTDDY